MAERNKDTLTARKGKKEKNRPKAGTIKELTQVLWTAISTIETHIIKTAANNEVDTTELCKLTHALSQSASTYLKAIEVGELESRVEALEQSQRVLKDIKRAA